MHWLSVSSRSRATLDDSVGKYYDRQTVSSSVTPGFVSDAGILNFVHPSTT